MFRERKKTLRVGESEREGKEDEEDGDGQRDSIIGGGFGIIGVRVHVTGAWIQAFP